MSLVTAIRDYIEFFNAYTNDFTQLITSSEGLSLTKIVMETGIYILKTLQTGLLYIISFQWVRDFTVLPIIVPNWIEDLILHRNPPNVDDLFVTTLTIPTIKQDSFLLGFGNSFFLSLPISLVHILAVRRLFIQGVPAGVYTLGGYIAGRLLFILFTIGGLRVFLVPWLSLEPLNYLVGIIVLIRIILTIPRERLRQLSGWNHPSYKDFFLTSFLLAWCEHTSIFQYFGNLTSNATSTIFDFHPGTALFEKIVYSSGLLLGCLLFSGLFIFVLSLQREKLFNAPVGSRRLSQIIQRLNKGTFLLIVIFTVQSIPFYGVDYLFTGPLGFVSQDIAFHRSVLDPYNIDDFRNEEQIKHPNTRDDQKEVVPLGELGKGTNSETIDKDVARFDRGEYLVLPFEPPDDELSVGPVGFEDLNYDGENAWLTRTELMAEMKPRYARGAERWIRSIENAFVSWGSQFAKDLQQYRVQFTQLNLSRFYPLPRSSFIVNDDDEETQRYLFAPSKDSKDNVERYQTEYGGPGTDPNSVLYTNEFDKKDLRRAADISDASIPPRFIYREERDINPETQLQPTRLEINLKNRYYSSYLYKGLLNIDIDLFLKRQPSDYYLNAHQEFDLYSKREKLMKYYDSLRWYTNADQEQWLDFNYFFRGTKSFANKVYNQQFKGTLRTVSRLFALSEKPRVGGYLRYDSTNNEILVKPVADRKDKSLSNSSTETTGWYGRPTLSQALQQAKRNPFTFIAFRLDTSINFKYDQPLYTFNRNNPFSFYHEELPTADSSLLESIQNSLLTAETGRENTEFTLALQDYSTSGRPNKVTRRSLDKARSSSEDFDSNARNNFHSVSPTPLYAGWNDNTRTFVLTSKIAPMSVAGEKVFLPVDKVKNFYQDTRTSTETQILKSSALSNTQPADLPTQVIQFTTWPLSFEMMQSNPKTNAKIPYQTMFEQSWDPLYFVKEKEASADEKESEDNKLEIVKKYFFEDFEEVDEDASQGDDLDSFETGKGHQNIPSTLAELAREPYYELLYKEPEDLENLESTFGESAEATRRMSKALVEMARENASILLPSDREPTDDGDATLAKLSKLGLRKGLGDSEQEAPSEEEPSLTSSESRYLFSRLFNYLTPRRGGFIWPGTTKPAFLEKLTKEQLPPYIAPSYSQTDSLQSKTQTEESQDIDAMNSFSQSKKNSRNNSFETPFEEFSEDEED